MNPIDENGCICLYGFYVEGFTIAHVLWDRLGKSVLDLTRKPSYVEVHTEIQQKWTDHQLFLSQPTKCHSTTVLPA